MCGILGTVNRPIDLSILDQIRHRGPDSGDLTSYSLGMHRIDFGHRRLAIVDLSPAGHQPMQTPDGLYSIIYNGEIYNHAELRKTLNNLVSFRGHSDTETILYLLSQYSLAAIPSLNGIFAFAFLDIPKKRLYFVRDQFGVKPLYYCQTGNTLAFCSEIKPIARLMQQSLSMENLAELLRLRYSPSPDTLFRDIRKVRPGHLIEVDLSEEKLRIEERPYLLPVSPIRDDLSMTVAQAEYGGLLHQAVERQLMADVDVGIFLSGGVDSALVAKFAQSRLPFKMKAFTVGFSETDDSDEIVAARDTADCIGLEHHTVSIGFDDFLNKFKECIITVEEPLATESVIPMYFLAELAAKHVKVVLSGQGADEPLGGYRRYQGELVRKFVPPMAARFLNGLAQGTGLQSEHVMRALPALAERDEIKQLSLVYEVFSREQIQALIGIQDEQADERIAYFYRLLGCPSFSDSAARMMSLDLRMNLADDLLLYTDKISMKHSLECRVPMLDLDLVRFMETLPVRYRVRFGNGKLIHKRLAEAVLPLNIVRRPKKGFTTPTRKWFKEKDAIRDLLLGYSSKFTSYFNRHVVETIISEHERGYDRMRHIFLLMGIYYWLEEFM